MLKSTCSEVREGEQPKRRNIKTHRQGFADGRGHFEDSRLADQVLHSNSSHKVIIARGWLAVAKAELV
jgi:hypothetical protein